MKKTKEQIIKLCWPAATFSTMTTLCQGIWMMVDLFMEGSFLFIVTVKNVY